MRGANWRDATRRTNLGCLTSHVSNTSPSKTSLSFRCRCYSTGWLRKNTRTPFVYHVRDLIKAALAEALDQEVLERNVARKTVIPEIEESDKPVLPVDMYAKLPARLDGIRDRAILIDCLFLRLTTERTLRPDLGMLQRQCIHYCEYCRAWPLAAQENQTEEPLRTYQLQACRDPPSRAQRD
jgi:hypothetical protein